MTSQESIEVILKTIAFTAAFTSYLLMDTGKIWIHVHVHTCINKILVEFNLNLNMMYMYM